MKACSFYTFAPKPDTLKKLETKLNMRWMCKLLNYRAIEKYLELSEQSMKWLMYVSIAHSCGRGWRSCRRNCWMMCMPSRWRPFRTWSSVSGSSSRPHCNSLLMSSKREKISFNNSGVLPFHVSSCNKSFNVLVCTSSLSPVKCVLLH